MDFLLVYTSEIGWSVSRKTSNQVKSSERCWTDNAKMVGHRVGRASIIVWNVIGGEQNRDPEFG